MTPSATGDNSWSLSVCRLAGYGLLAIALINLVDAFVPSYFMDPTWEIATVNLLIERMPVALVGMVLVLVGGVKFRLNIERLLLFVLSWSTLAVAILFLLLIPLTASAALRLDRQNTEDIAAQYNQQLTQIDQVQEQLQSASEQELNTLLQAFRNQGQFTDTSDAQALRQELTTEVDRAKRRASNNRQEVQNAQRLNLRKSVVKLSLASLVSAWLFFALWYMTRWTRRPRYWAAMAS